jgi:hypothetical protein
MWKQIVVRTLDKAGYTLVKQPGSRAKSDLLKLEAEIVERGKSIIRKVSPEFQVLNGPFKGISYPSLDITEAALVPKIVGTYEAQLHPFITQVTNTNYSDIIDVGSAEGYYAVGFAHHMRDSKIHCYDINEKDLDFCRKMAKKNGLTNLTYNNRCTPETLITFDFKGKGFILCDCEGYELELFTPEVINKLKNIDLLIEMHDVANPVISSAILSRFQYTHNFQVVNNLNVKRPSLTGLENLSEEDKAFSMLEHRGGLYQNIFMEWAFLTSKQN